MPVGSHPACLKVDLSGLPHPQVITGSLDIFGVTNHLLDLIRLDAADPHPPVSGTGEEDKEDIPAGLQVHFLQHSCPMTGQFSQVLFILPEVLDDGVDLFIFCPDGDPLRPDIQRLHHHAPLYQRVFQEHQA